MLLVARALEATFADLALCSLQAGAGAGIGLGADGSSSGGRCELGRAAGGACDASVATEGFSRSAVAAARCASQAAPSPAWERRAIARLEGLLRQVFSAAVQRQRRWVRAGVVHASLPQLWRASKSASHVVKGAVADAELLLPLGAGVDGEACGAAVPSAQNTVNVVAVHAASMRALVHAMQGLAAAKAALPLA